MFWPSLIDKLVEPSLFCVPIEWIWISFGWSVVESFVKNGTNGAYDADVDGGEQEADVDGRCCTSEAEDTRPGAIGARDLAVGLSNIKFRRCEVTFNAWNVF